MVRSGPVKIIRAAREIAAQVLALSAVDLRICLGPDGGVNPGKPHHVVPHAIEEFVREGLPIAVVLGAVTSTAAEASRLERVGRVAAGYEADLVAAKVICCWTSRRSIGSSGCTGRVTR